MEYQKKQTCWRTDQINHLNLEQKKRVEIIDELRETYAVNKQII